MTFDQNIRVICAGFPVRIETQCAYSLDSKDTHLFLSFYLSLLSLLQLPWLPCISPPFSLPHFYSNSLGNFSGASTPSLTVTGASPFIYPFVPPIPLVFHKFRVLFNPLSTMHLYSHAYCS